MGYRVFSAFAAGVLSILLIFTLFSSAAAFELEAGSSDGIGVANHGSPCAMDSSASAVPFANTRLVPSSGADVSEENKLLNIPSLSVVGSGDVISAYGTMEPSALSDRHIDFLVRLLI